MHLELRSSWVALSLAAVVQSQALTGQAHLQRTPLLDRANWLVARGSEVGEAVQPLVHEVALAELARRDGGIAWRDGSTTAYTLPLKVALGEKGDSDGRSEIEPIELELLDGNGKPLETGRGRRRPRVRVVPGEQVVDCLRDPAFRGLERHRVTAPDDVNARAAWIGTSRDFELTFERFGGPAQLLLRGAIVGGLDGMSAPTLSVLVDGKEVARVDCWRRQELDRPFELPPASGSQTLVFRVAYRREEPSDPRLVLNSLRLVEKPGNDHLVLTSESDSSGWRVRYRAMAPAVVTPIAEGRRRVTLLAGEAAIILEMEQAIVVELDGKTFGSSTERTDEVSFPVPKTDEYEISFRAGVGPVGEKSWLVQPAAFPFNEVRLGRGKVSREIAVGQPVVTLAQMDREARQSVVLAAGRNVELPLPEGPAGLLRLVAVLHSFGLPHPTPSKRSYEISLEVVDASGGIVDLGRRWVDGDFAFCKEREIPLPALEEGARLRIAAHADPSMPVFGKLVRFVVADPTLLRESSAPRPPNVLVYLIDTLRADHCSAYGYARKTTPVLEAIGAEGLVFERAYAQSPWTRPSTATLLSGLLAPYHGAGKDRGVAPEIETLAERMRASGRATAAFVCNPHVHAASMGFDREFETFVIEDGEYGQRRSDLVTFDVKTWIERHVREPFFVFVHTVDPHAAYNPPRETAGFFGKHYKGSITPARTHSDLLNKQAPLSAEDLQHVIDLYDEEILFNDRQLGVLVDELKNLGLWDETLLVVVSDHGEEFGEHGGFGHAGRLWEEQLRVPLVMKLPKSCGVPPRRVGVSTPVRQLDVLPTIIGRLGIAGGAPAQGVDLVEWMEGGEPLWVIAEEEPGMRCLVLGDLKLLQEGLHEPGKERTRLFDLANDPLERRDLFGERGDVAIRLAARIDAIFRELDQRGFARRDTRGVADLTDEERASLRELGYVDR